MESACPLRWAASRILPIQSPALTVPSTIRFASPYVLGVDSIPSRLLLMLMPLAFQVPEGVD
jgi:hypothetical protein